jgi:hypothetical protein
MRSRTGSWLQVASDAHSGQQPVDAGAEITWEPGQVPGLQEHLCGYRYFMTTGKPVPRNHFGALQPYSPGV